MATIPIPVVGGSNSSRSLPQSRQRTVNWYVQVDPESKHAVCLMPTPGAKAFGTTATGDDRGSTIFNDQMYTVTGATLYRIDSNGSSNSIGTIAGTQRCIFANDGTYLIIATGSTPYSYDGTTLALMTDADLENPNSVAFLNSQMLFDGNDGRFVSADAGDPLTIDGLNYATAESAPDDTIIVFEANEIIYLGGSGVIEPWDNVGIGNPPFDRLRGARIAVGIAAIHSVAKQNDVVYFLGSDKSVYQIQGTSARRLSTIGLGNELESYTTISDAVGFAFTLQAQNFYFLSFPTQNKSWLFNEASQTWVEMADGADEDRHLASSYVYCYGKHLIKHHSTGAIYEWDLNTYTDAGSTIRRGRDSQFVHGGLVAPQYLGKTMTMNRLEIIMETGVGLATGQGEDPQVMLSWTDDGRTYSSEIWATAGPMGNYFYKVEFFQLGSFVSRSFRIAVTDPVKWVLHAATADLEVESG